VRQQKNVTMPAYVALGLAGILDERSEPTRRMLLPAALDELLTRAGIKERLGHVVDAVVHAGDCETEPTTVVDLSEPEPKTVTAAPVIRTGVDDLVLQVAVDAVVCVGVRGPGFVILSG
jgi:hypothetical protein